MQAQPLLDEKPHSLCNPCFNQAYARPSKRTSIFFFFWGIVGGILYIKLKPLLLQSLAYFVPRPIDWKSYIAKEEKVLSTEAAMASSSGSNNAGLSQIMEKNFVLLVGILLLQIVVHCSGADSKVESGVKTDLDRKSSLTSDNSNGSIDNTVGSNSVSNANNVQKVKKVGDQVVGSKEGIGDKKSNPSKEVGVKESDNVAKSGGGSSEGSKLEGEDKKQKQSDGLESKEVPKEVDNGANTVSVNPIRKEGTRSEECDTSNMCTDEGNQLVACLKVPGNDSHHLSLLIKNMAKGPLLVAIVAPDFVRLEETKIQLEEKENRKVLVSVGNGGAGSSIVLKAGNGRCNLDLKDLITNTSRKEPENSSNFAYTNFLKQKPTIAILFFASAMILASAWMCISFRNRRVSGSGLKYQKLDKDLPISNGKNRVLHVNDGWDNNWDDNWDDEEAPHTPSMPITPSLSGKGLASRRLNKEAWKV